MHVLIKSSLLDSVLVVVNTIMFDGVILGDACLIVMSSTRRLQAITGNAGFPSSPHGCLDCDRPQDAETVKLAVRPFLVLIYRQLPLGSLYPPLSCSGLVTMVFFRGGYQRHCRFLAIPRFYCGCCGIVCDADGCHAIPNGDSANILAIDTAIILFLIFIQSSFGH